MPLWFAVEGADLHQTCWFLSKQLRTNFIRTDTAIRKLEGKEECALMVFVE